jgi:hypothetical protein
MIEEGGSAEATDAWLRVVVALVDSRSAALRALQEHTPRPDFGSDRPIGEARWRITKE